MAYENTEHGFIDYRYYKPKFHYAKKIALKLDVNQDDSLITYSCAICADDDNFCRKTAREITDKRMEEGVTFTGHFNRDITLVDNIKLITRDIALGKDADQPPTRLVKQLHEAFGEVEIAKIIDESDLFAISEQAC